jgi:hypothetical protein
MSVRDPRLSRTQQAKYLPCLQQMQSEGIDVEIPEDWEQASRALDIELAPPSESIVFEGPTRGIYYAVWIRLLALRSGLTLVGWDITTSWDDQIVPESFNSVGPIYNLGRQEYRRCEVLNQKIESTLSLRRGQIVEGWILANGLRPIPPQFDDHSTAAFEVRFLDQFNYEHPAQGTLSVSRRSPRDSVNRPRGTGLYGLYHTGMPSELSVSEQSALRCRELCDSGKSSQKTTVAIDAGQTGNCSKPNKEQQSG